jgi:hypothetical protein
VSACLAGSSSVPICHPNRFNVTSTGWTNSGSASQKLLYQVVALISGGDMPYTALSDPITDSAVTGLVLPLSIADSSGRVSLSVRATNTEGCQSMAQAGMVIQLTPPTLLSLTTQFVAPGQSSPETGVCICVCTQCGDDTERAEALMQSTSMFCCRRCPFLPFLCFVDCMGCWRLNAPLTPTPPSVGLLCVQWLLPCSTGPPLQWHPSSMNRLLQGAPMTS